jgi:hypothetical protein
MKKNFELRRKMFGDSVLGATNLKMVALAESVGGAWPSPPLQVDLPHSQFCSAIRPSGGLRFNKLEVGVVIVWSLAQVSPSLREAEAQSSCFVHRKTRSWHFEPCARKMALRLLPFKLRHQIWTDLSWNGKWMGRNP